MTIGKLQTNSVISAYQNTATQNPHVSEDAKKLGLSEEQTIGKSESRYELDGTLKDEHKPFGMPKTDKLEKAEEAKKAEDSAKALFGAGSAENMPTYHVVSDDYTEGTVDVISLLVKSGLVPSRSEGRRAIEQGGVSVDGDKITDLKQSYTKDQINAGLVLKRGKKKFVRIVGE